ncbi:MAG: ATP-dependent DNA helicase RecG [Gammaproteobacteria bacterium]|jgi:ATP-dependent DNA helicase RecG|nr:ATP-dependent DNA helicase RecG [Gammaproteobacteria bacterium]|tara:strand:- start:67 stop:2130 length:2064 start_codon:yes stop_codon:yes gene_type:complete
MTIDLLDLKGVGEKGLIKLNKIGIRTIEDLLFHLPIRYQDKTKIAQISNSAVGNKYYFEGTIEKSNIIFFKKRMFLVRISDETGFIQLRFFYFNKSQMKNFSVGKKIRCYGELREVNNVKEMIHPECEFFESNEIPELNKFLTPVYPITEGLYQFRIRNFIQQSLELLKTKKIYFPEILPKKVLEKYNLIDINTALLNIHNPDSDTSYEELITNENINKKRLVFEELLAHQLIFKRIRSFNSKLLSFDLNNDEKPIKKLINNLPFNPTKSQLNVMRDIINDMQKNTPMTRLVQGDVGSGKTLVALFGALHAISNGYQVAFMAPTEILSQQHYQSIKLMLKDFDINIAILYSGMKAKEKAMTIEDIRLGNINIVIGTHSLIQKQIKFFNLALVIIDEQHKFGVHQRMTLSTKGKKYDTYPHQLILTATPIPRTLAMTLYGNLDYSVIDEMPRGRQEIDTIALPEDRRNEVLERITSKCKDGSQVYWVCPLIDESEVMECKAATNTYEELCLKLKDINIGLIHGRMKMQEKEKVMNDFRSKKIDLLVSTTIIEVGLDIPNATVIIIENSERMGLSQLHQLRGRVGRGEKKSNCILIYKSGLSEIAKNRIDILRRCRNGFDIAKEDLDIRGPGEILGKKQKGDINFKIANIARDHKFIKDTKECSNIISSDTSEKLAKRWINEEIIIGKS